MRIPTGEEIKKARQDRGLTQAELAARADVSQPLIARIESGDVDPTLATLHTIVSGLNDAETSIEQEKIELLLPSALKNARTESGYTQGELAEAAGVSQPLVSRIEREDVNPRASTLRSLFEHLESVSTADTEMTVEQTGRSNILAQIESEFEDLDTTNHSSDFEAIENQTQNEKDNCSNCNEDLSEYPDPTFCPNCGTELDC